MGQRIIKSSLQPSDTGGSMQNWEPCHTGKNRKGHSKACEACREAMGHSFQPHSAEALSISVHHSIHWLRIVMFVFPLNLPQCTDMYRYTPYGQPHILSIRWKLYQIWVCPTNYEIWIWISNIHEYIYIYIYIIYNYTYISHNIAISPERHGLKEAPAVAQCCPPAMPRQDPRRRGPRVSWPPNGPPGLAPRKGPGDGAPGLHEIYQWSHHSITYTYRFMIYMCICTCSYKC